MDLTTLPLVFAQSQPAAPNTNSIYLLALRRWCSSLTLSSPQAFSGGHVVWAFTAGLCALLLLAILIQGPVASLKQLFDLVGHVSLVRTATRRVWRASRLVSITIAFTVLSWTVARPGSFMQESRKADLVMLTKSRGLGELALEEGMFAALTPLRDVAGLGDNLPLLVIAAILVFRASFDLPTPGSVSFEGDSSAVAGARSGWSTLVWGCAALYALYRIVSRLAASTDLPLGNCLVAEAVIVPLLMLVSDGFLLAWVLVELRNAGLDDAGEDRLDVRPAVAIFPAATLACVLALPARYVATFVFLGQAYLPTSVSETALGDYVRWQLGWGLTDLQAASLVGVGLAGAVAWSRGTMAGAIAGYLRLLNTQGGRLIAVIALAGAAAAMVSAAAYAVVLLLPAQTWVLGAADCYAHFATLPIGLWTLAACIELAQRSLPTATLARSTCAPHRSISIPTESHHCNKGNKAMNRREFLQTSSAAASLCAGRIARSCAWLDQPGSKASRFDRLRLVWQGRPAPLDPGRAGRGRLAVRRRQEDARRGRRHRRSPPGLKENPAHLR